MTRRILTLFLVVMLPLIVPARSNAADGPGGSQQLSTDGSVNWPMFKNQTSRQSSNSQETTINKDNARFLTEAWEGLLGEIVDTSSPAIVNGVVYVGSFDGNLYAFNANGCGFEFCSPLWVGVMDSQFATLSSPAVVNGVVYIGSEDHKLYAFAAGGCGQNTCSPLWTATMGGAIDSAPL